MTTIKLHVCELYPSSKKRAEHLDVSTLERIIFRMEIIV